MKYLLRKVASSWKSKYPFLYSPRLQWQTPCKKQFCTFLCSLEFKDCASLSLLATFHKRWVQAEPKWVSSTIWAGWQLWKLLRTAGYFFTFLHIALQCWPFPDIHQNLVTVNCWLKSGTIYHRHSDVIAYLFMLLLLLFRNQEPWWAQCSSRLLDQLFPLAVCTLHFLHTFWIDCLLCFLAKLGLISGLWCCSIMNYIGTSLPLFVALWSLLQHLPRSQSVCPVNFAFPFCACNVYCIFCPCTIIFKRSLHLRRWASGTLLEALLQLPLRLSFAFCRSPSKASCSKALNGTLAIISCECSKSVICVCALLAWHFLDFFYIVLLCKELRHPVSNFHGALLSLSHSLRLRLVSFCRLAYTLHFLSLS